jgi:hypothetical protein
MEDIVQSVMRLADVGRPLPKAVTSPKRPPPRRGPPGRGRF